MDELYFVPELNVKDIFHNIYNCTMLKLTASVIPLGGFHCVWQFSKICIFIVVYLTIV